MIGDLSGELPALVPVLAPVLVDRFGTSDDVGTSKQRGVGCFAAASGIFSARLEMPEPPVLKPGLRSTGLPFLAPPSSDFCVALCTC